MPTLDFYGHRPSPGELSLLRAALGRAPLEPAGSALVEAAVRTGIDQGTLRLLPLLHHAPAAAALAPELRAEVERAYREAQMRFVRLERELATVTGWLAEAGIPVMVLKGYALARACYANPAHRPMWDLDIAVPADRFEEAWRLLADRGVRAKDDGRRFVVGPAMHAAALVTAAGTEIDLHRNVLFCSRWDGADEPFWSRAVPITVRGRPAVTLSAADQLLHACLHGYRENPSPSPVRWIADALAILGRSGLDPAGWAILLAEAERHRCEGVLGAALGFLAERFEAPVPVEVLDRLAAAPQRPFEQAYFRFAGKRPRRFGLPWRSAAAWYDYRRHRNGVSIPRAVLGFPAWVASRWGIEPTLPALAREAARRWRPAGS